MLLENFYQNGEKGQSREFSLHSIKAKIELFKNEKHWPVIFLGSEFKEISNVSFAMGGDQGMSVNMTQGNFMASARTLASKSAIYGSAARATCDSYNTMNFTDAEKAELNKSRKYSEDEKSTV